MMVELIVRRLCIAGKVLLPSAVALMFVIISFFCRQSTVLTVSNCVGHDGTSYSVLKHVEVEF